MLHRHGPRTVLSLEQGMTISLEEVTVLNVDCLCWQVNWVSCVRSKWTRIAWCICLQTLESKDLIFFHFRFPVYDALCDAIVLTRP